MMMITCLLLENPVENLTAVFIFDVISKFFTAEQKSKQS